METARCILAFAATIAGVLIYNSSPVASAPVATITCTAPATTPVTLNPGDSFVLNCNPPFNTPVPANFHTHACPGTGAKCKEPVLYTKLFEKAANHAWVTPADSASPSHTWTAPPSGNVQRKTVFSVGCSQPAAGQQAAQLCVVDVTVNSTAKTIVSGVLLAVCSLASMAVM